MLGVSIQILIFGVVHWTSSIAFSQLFGFVISFFIQFMAMFTSEWTKTPWRPKRKKTGSVFCTRSKGTQLFMELFSTLEPWSGDSWWFWSSQCSKTYHIFKLFRCQSCPLSLSGSSQRTMLTKLRMKISQNLSTSFWFIQAYGLPWTSKWRTHSKLRIWLAGTSFFVEFFWLQEVFSSLCLA